MLKFLRELVIASVELVLWLLLVTFVIGLVAGLVTFAGDLL